MTVDEGRGRTGAGQRRVVYCLVPPDLAPKLHELLRDHFAEEPEVEVIVERRSRERRASEERRAGGGAERRFGERRAALVPLAQAPELPRRARRYAERIGFVARVAYPSERAEDLDTARQIARFQAGDSEAFATLYMRYFDRIYAYLRVCLNNRDDAEDATQQVFANVLEALPGFRHGAQPFRAWLFTIARNTAVSELRRKSRVVPADPETIANHLSAAEAEAEAADEELLPEELPQLDWITDPDLLLFVERLPLPQRQALVLRYVLDLKHAEIARIMGRSSEDVRALQHRAITLLRQRLAAIGRTPQGEGRRIKMKERVPQAYVLRSRRWALDP